MAKFYKKIEKAPVSYITCDGVIKKKHLVPINGVKISNSFDIPYVRGIVGLFNAMISLFMYHATYDRTGDKRKYPISQDHIYLPYHLISTMINRCEAQSINIKNQLHRLFDLDITRAHEKFGANKFRLSERVIEFLYIFTEEQLHEFMNKYEITDSEDKYRLRQLYKFRVVRPSDKNMDNHWDDYQSFMKNNRQKDFTHFCSTNNVSIQSRVEKIELHINLLSNKQKEQLQRIKAQITEGATKLLNRFHWLLIKLEQFVTGMLAKDNITAPEKSTDEDKIESHVTNRNKTEGEMQKTHEIAATQLKDPEEVPLQDIVRIATFWNIMARGRDMEFMYSLADKKIQSIVTLVKSHGKERIFEAIENTGNLSLNSTLKWSSFTSNSLDVESRFNKIWRFKHFDNRNNDTQIAFAQRKLKFWVNTYVPEGTAVPTFDNQEEKRAWFNSYKNVVGHDSIPEFTSRAEAKAWFKSQIDNM